MHGGPADEAVVVVKPHTEEGAVTYPRVKYGASGKDAGGEGRNMSDRSRIRIVDRQSSEKLLTRQKDRRNQSGAGKEDDESRSRRKTK